MFIHCFCVHWYQPWLSQEMLCIQYRLQNFMVFLYYLERDIIDCQDSQFPIFYVILGYWMRWIRICCCIKIRAFLCYKDGWEERIMGIDYSYSVVDWKMQFDLQHEFILLFINNYKLKWYVLNCTLSTYQMNYTYFSFQDSPCIFV